MWYKLILFFKKYWLLIAIIVLTLATVLFLRKSNIIEKLLTLTRDSYQNQINIIENLNKKEKEKKENLQQLYIVTMELLEKKYREEEKVLELWEKKRVKELVSLYENNLEVLNQKLKEEFKL